jgi:predicted nucleotidyltransferase
VLPLVIRAFCDKWKVEEFSLFGPAVEGELNEDGKVDIVVHLEENSGWSLYEWVEMIDELKVIFGHDVHLVEESAVRNPFRKHHIRTTKHILHAG